MAQEGPYFNLKAVVQNTGLKPDTLRAWERRYGLPIPKRSEGGHRLYSQRDIETVKWLMTRQRDGLSISRAVELWKQVEARGRNPLHMATPMATKAASIPASQPEGETVAQLRKQWMDACQAFDEQRAEQLLNQAFTLYAPETVAVELLQRAVARNGESWYKWDITVQQNQFCSSLAVRRLEALVMGAPPPMRPGRVLAACPPEEHHVIGLLLLTFLLRRRGWEVVYLGANVPIEQLETTVELIQPQLVVMAAQQLSTAATLQETAQVLRNPQAPVAYGGLVFNLLPALRQRIAGHFLGEQLDGAPSLVESLITASRPVPAADRVPLAYLKALDHFKERQGFIEARVIQSLNSERYAQKHLAQANRELGLNIGAALALGDMDFLGTDVGWVDSLLRIYELPLEMLYGYLHAYHESAREQLDERGQPIVTWLARLLNGHSQN